MKIKQIFPNSRYIFLLSILLLISISILYGKDDVFKYIAIGFLPVIILLSYITTGIKFFISLCIFSLTLSIVAIKILSIKIIYGSLCILFSLFIPLFYRKKIIALEKKILPAIEKIENENNLTTKKLQTLNQQLKILSENIENISALYKMAREMIKTLDSKQLLEKFVLVLRNECKVNKIVGFRISTKNEVLPVVSYGIEQTSFWKEFINRNFYLLNNSDSVSIAEKMYVFAGSFMSDLLRQKEPVVSTDLKNESIIFTPINDGKNAFGCVISVIPKENESSFLYQSITFARQFALGLRRAYLFQILEERARFDGLTGLTLRRYFYERINNEILNVKRYNSTFAILMIDIDDFKNINDTFGHPTGDQVLIQLSNIFREELHPGVLISRYGGEEFTILISLITKDETKLIAEKIRKKVQQHIFKVDGLELKITISIGCVICPEDGLTQGELIRKADMCLYKSKYKGKNTVCFLTDE